ncbi:MAG: dicarboxylate/amino acid:cation symporter [Planctomycetaceae bacterium]|nr:dicarboxylate/amino acid:cation symporter [Planctomycetaceae bacterium]
MKKMLTIIQIMVLTFQMDKLIMMIVLNAVGLPPEYIGSILVVDWLLDRFRTAINTFGDSVGCAIVERSFPKEAAVAPAVEAAGEGVS